MIPHVVVDVGNTRIKWGLCDGTRPDPILRTASLPVDPVAWDEQAEVWALHAPQDWVLASVQPSRSERLRAWLEQRGDRVHLLSRAAQLPLEVRLEHPDRAGIDRLLNGVASLEHLAPGRGAVLIDAGSAVTIDWLDEQHAFCGGSISPGLDLMAEALHHYTALLPRIQVSWPVPELPGTATIPAMQVGIALAVAGGIRESVTRYVRLAKRMPRVFFTGGQSALLAKVLHLDEERNEPWSDYLLWPTQTLVGIYRSARNLP